MTFHSIRNFQPQNRQPICQSSAGAPFVFALVLLVIIIVLIADPMQMGGLRWVMIAFLGLFVLMPFRVFLHALDVQNWLLRRHGDGVAIKFRSYLNRHFAEQDEVIVVLSKDDIAYFRKYRETEYTPSFQRRGSTTVRWLTYLDIVLREPGEELGRRLEEERNRKPPGTWHKSKYVDHPARLIDGNILRLTWRGRGSITPSVDDTMMQLAPVAMTGHELKVTKDFTKADSPEEVNAQIKEMEQRGDSFAAHERGRRIREKWF